MTTTFLNGTTAASVSGANSLIATGAGNIQCSVSGSGTVVATLRIHVSLDRTTYGPLDDFVVRGVGLASKIVLSGYPDSFQHKVELVSIAGAGAAVTAIG